jgi:hypothetical protein
VPVRLKAATVPADHGLGPDNPDRAQDGWKESVQPDLQQAVRIRQPQSLGQLAHEDVELLTEHQILGFQPGAGFEPQAQRIRQLFQPLNHLAAEYLVLRYLSLGSNFR